MSTAASPRATGLWLPLIVAVAGPLACAAVWYGPTEWDHGHRTLTVLSLAMLTVMVLAAWFLFLSPFPRWLRLMPALLLLAAAGALVLSLREFHFTGDMFPVLSFRWEPTPDELLERDRAQQAAQKQTESPGAGPIADSIRQNSFESYFGRDRQGTVPEVRLRDDWSAAAPRVVWHQRSGGGYAGFVEARGRLVTTEQRRDEEAVVAYDVDTGRELWRYAYPAHFKETQGGNGPRATPALVTFAPTDDGHKPDRVLSLGAAGHLVCLDLGTGDLRWSADVLENNANLRWGMAGSPLVLDGGRVIVAPGAQSAAAKGRGLIAYDLDSGHEVWASGTRRGSYSSPTRATLGGLEQILVLGGEGLTGYRADDGQELWHFPWVPMPPEGINASQPLVLDDDRVLISSGYDMGSAMLHVKESGGRWEAEPVWQNAAMRCKFSSPVYRDGFLYGLDEGILTCLDAKTGKRRWKDGRYGHGQMLLTGDRIVILSERGDLVLVAATPDGHRELGKVHVLDGDKTWNPPALVNNYAFVRNHLWMACLELPAER
ncbi:MAG TPA: PQQ-binding-like beta-propeller repeat protein [Gemmataceae bacterium]|nr:PQQ-binding-like beta-propeller repeat protein [Gemmataceae bacterium]